MRRILGVQMCSHFVKVEKEAFESRLEKVLPLLIKQFYATKNFNDDNQPGRFVKLQKDDRNTKDENEDPERLIQYHFLQVLNLVREIAANCSVFLKDKKYQDSVISFAGNNFIKFKTLL